MNCARNWTLVSLSFVALAAGCDQSGVPEMSSQSAGSKLPRKDRRQIASAPEKWIKAPGPLDSRASIVELTKGEMTETAYFSILLPADWRIEEQARERGDTDATFQVKGPDSARLFTVTVATDEPRFIQCFCAPWDHYTQYERDGIKYADLAMDIGSKKVRTLKAVGTKYGTDVHLSYKHYDPKLLDRIIESIRPF